jgi:hypothetical protein
MNRISVVIIRKGMRWSAVFDGAEEDTPSSGCVSPSVTM